MATEAQIKAQKKHDAENTRQVHLKLNRRTDGDVLEKLDSVPSRDESDVHGRFIDACLEERYTVDEWNSMSEDEQKECFAYWNLKFEGAAAEADRKWEAVKVMLDL